MTSRRLEAFGVDGIGEVLAGDDLAQLITQALAPDRLRDGDIVIVSSKVVSKAEGRTMPGADRDTAIATQTVRVVAERATPRGPTRIVQSRSGPVLAAAGVDASNVAPGTLLLLPEDPDRSAAQLRHRLRKGTGAALGVVITDTAGRPWRDGQVDIAIGAAGITVVDDLRGAVDTHGQRLEVTVRAVADELASLADLVKGKLASVPVAVVRGLGALVRIDDAGASEGAARLLRSADRDWFRYGHVEAVRAAMGLPSGGQDCVPPVPVGRDDVPERLRRVLDVVITAPSPLAHVDGPGPTLRYEMEGATARIALADAVPEGQRDLWVATLGTLAQRVAAAAWTEDLAVTIDLVAPAGFDPLPSVLVSAASAPAV